MDILNNFNSYLSNISPLAYLVAFIGGILASFTPCVYPLIPITVGYIGIRSVGSRRKGFLLSIVYVLGVASTYSVLGGLAALTGGFLGQFTQNPWAYILVGNICMVLGLSLFEVFSLPVPKFFARRQTRARTGKLAETFLVGLASALVMSPCTAPILGSILLLVALKKNVIFGMTLLFVFAYGIGILLILVGTFSGLLANLPKSGEWLSKIKKVFAWFLLLASEYYFFKAGRLF